NGKTPKLLVSPVRPSTAPSGEALAPFRNTTLATRSACCKSAKRCAPCQTCKSWETFLPAAPSVIAHKSHRRRRKICIAGCAEKTSKIRRNSKGQTLAPRSHLDCRNCSTRCCFRHVL